ncbi:MAG: hypothetical protein IJC46_06905 [Clostridia bacterium]|nr:hypothetical protein [Clostridia bacterium]
MKRIQILCLFLVLCLCGCAAKQESADSFETLTTPEFTAPSEEKESTQADDADITADEAPDGCAPLNSHVLPTYDLDDYGYLKSYTYSMGTVIDTTPQTVDKIMEMMGPNGLIVSGYAFGERTGIEKTDINFHTRTQFKVDHVFYGNVASGDTIVIKEDYVLKSNGKETYIYSMGQPYSFLKNGEYVLMILRQAKSLEPGVYGPVRNAMPVAEDCDEWSEDYLDSLLDFFRGDPATYAYGEDGMRSYTVTDPDGSKREVIYYQPGKRWPQREISNEALIEEMQDNLLVYLATEFKIKIWPTEHVNYVPAHNGGTQAQLNPWQFPKET